MLGVVKRAMPSPACRSASHLLGRIVVAQVIVTYHPDDVDAFIALADAIEVELQLLLLLLLLLIMFMLDSSDCRGVALPASSVALTIYADGRLILISAALMSVAPSSG